MTLRLYGVTAHFVLLVDMRLHSGLWAPRCLPISCLSGAFYAGLRQYRLQEMDLCDVEIMGAAQSIAVEMRWLYYRSKDKETTSTPSRISPTNSMNTSSKDFKGLYLAYVLFHL